MKRSSSVSEAGRVLHVISKTAFRKKRSINTMVQLETWWDPKKCTYIDPQV